LTHENRHRIKKILDKENFVFARPLLPFGTVWEANAHCTHLQNAQATAPTEICKRVQLPISITLKHIL